MFFFKFVKVLFHPEHGKTLHQPLATPLSRKIPLHYQMVNMDSLSYLREISVYLLPPFPSITLPPRDFQAPLLISQLQVNTANKHNPHSATIQEKRPLFDLSLRIWKLPQESELHRSQECLFGSSL